MNNSIIEKIKLGVIGVGGRGSGVAENLINHPLCECVYICDTNDVRLNMAKDLFEKKQGNMVETTKDYKELLADDEVNLVLVGTPDFLHHEHAIAVCESGKHLFCEKPVGITLKQTHAILSAVVKAGIVFYIGCLGNQNGFLQWGVHVNSFQKIILTAQPLSDVVNVLKINDVTTIIEFRSGLQGTFNMNFICAKTESTRNWKVIGSKAEINTRGNKNTIRFTKRHSANDGEIIIPEGQLEGGHGGGDSVQADAFIDALTDPNGPHEARAGKIGVYWSNVMVMAAVESLKTGVPIDTDEFRKDFPFPK